VTRHAAIVGATASGKSALALALASELGDIDIVSLDSMQVYREMDIGTAKPSLAERAAVPHHLIDVADPAADWSVRATQGAAHAVVAEIEARGHRALLVGGTGLYVRAVIDALRVPATDPVRRAALEEQVATPEGLAGAYSRLGELDPVAAARIEPGNARRIVRALEVIELTGEPFSSFGPGLAEYGPPALDVSLIGIEPRADLSQRIARRFVAMLDDGLLDEVRALAARPAGLSRTARQAIGYQELLTHLRGDESLDASVARAIRRTNRFARRQWRWFRRDPRISWLAADENPAALVPAVLARWEDSPATSRHSAR
jgi:tRNA dimethylallyltransferase